MRLFHTVWAWIRCFGPSSRSVFRWSSDWSSSWFSWFPLLRGFLLLLLANFNLGHSLLRWIYRLVLQICCKIELTCLWHNLRWVRLVDLLRASIRRVCMGCHGCCGLERLRVGISGRLLDGTDLGCCLPCWDWARSSLLLPEYFLNCNHWLSLCFIFGCLHLTKIILLLWIKLILLISEVCLVPVLKIKRIHQ